MKKLGLGLGVLIVLLVGAILIVPSFLNWNEYKAQIEQTASDYTGRHVKIKGDMSLSLLPTSALSAKDVSVTNMEGGRADYMLSLKSLDVKVSFPSVISSLFGGKVKVEKFILVDPVIALEILPDGRGNWEFGSEGTGATGPASAPTSSADISLDKFQIVNGQVSFEDMASGQLELLRKINANVKVKSMSGPFDVTGSAKYKGLDADIVLNLGKNRPGKKVPLSLSLGLLGKKVQATVMGGVILSGVDSVFAGKVGVNAEDAGDMLTALDRFQGDKKSPGRKIGQNFSLDMVVNGVRNRAKFSELNVQLGQSRGQGQAEVTLGDKIKFSGGMSVNKLDVDSFLGGLNQDTSGGSPDGPAGPGASSVPQDVFERISGNLDISLGALKYNNKIASQISVTLQADDGVAAISSLKARMPGGAGLNFSGQITGTEGAETFTPVLSGKLSLNASNLRGLLTWLKVDVGSIPSGQLAQFSYTSNVKMTPDLLQLYGMVGNLDTLSFTGGLSSALGARPAYGVQLNVKNLNVDSYLVQGEGAESAVPDYKKLLSGLDDVDVNYVMTASDLTFQKMKITSAQLEGVLLGGVLEAKKILLKDAAGVNLTASGQGRHFSTKPELSLTFDADARSLVSLQRGLKWATDFDVARLGKSHVKGTISTTFEKADVDVKSTVGVNKLDIKGTIRSATLKQFPEIGSVDLEVDGRSSSLAAVIDHFNLPLSKPMARDDRPVALVGRVKTSSNMIDLDGTMDVAGGQLLIKGRQKGQGGQAALDMSLEMKGAETREFIRGLGVDFRPAAQKLGVLDLKVKVAGTGDNYNLSTIVGAVGPVKLSGTGQLNLAGVKPVVTLNVKAGDIPLHDFLPENAESGAGKPGNSPKKTFGNWSKAPLNLNLLSAYAGQARISAASLRYNNYNFENPVFETSLKEGKLTVSNFSGRLFGGEVALSGHLSNGANPAFSLDMNVKQGSLAQATQASAGLTPVTGFFDMTGHYTGKGVSQHGLMSSLTGNGEIVASPGLISGIDVPALSSQLAQMDDKNAFLSLLGTALSGGSTAYKGGRSQISAQNGQINLTPIDIELDGATSKVDMALDLLKWDIRSKGKLALIDHPLAPPIEVNIAGNISDPKVIYKTDRLEKYVGAKIASNMLQKLIGGEGGLEGLFGEQPKDDTGGTTPPAVGPGVVGQGGVSTESNPSAGQKDPAGDFGKRLLQKLFEKDKQTPPPKTPPADKKPKPDSK